MKRRVPIVVAEDSATQRLLLASILSSEEFELVQAEDGRQALELVRSRDPDLLITDREMPNLDGLALTRLLRADAQWAGLPILMVTARADDASRLAGLECGVDDYLFKPFSRAEVIARVRNLVRLRGSMRALADAQRRAMAAEKLAALGRLAGGLRHELNNPLAVVMAGLSMYAEYARMLLDAIPAEARDATIADIAADLPSLAAHARDGCARLRAIADQFRSLQTLVTPDAVGMVDLERILRGAVPASADVEIRLAAPEPVRLAAGAAELTNCFGIILGRFAALTAPPMIATLAPGRLALAGARPHGPQIDASAFFDPNHVTAGGRLAFDFGLDAARNVLTNLGAEFHVASPPGQLEATIAFP